MPATQQKIIIITAPSGAGKTSITRYLLDKYANLTFSISATTRQKRENEVDAKDYYYISVDSFQQKIKENAFAEWEMVYEGKYYGTLKTELERIWSESKVPILDIDVKGAIHIQQQYKDQTLAIFIEPPSVEELKRRLEIRGTETQENIATRINKAAYEISFKNNFDVCIVNEDLQKACEEAEKTIIAFLKS